MEEYGYRNGCLNYPKTRYTRIKFQENYVYVSLFGQHSMSQHNSIELFTNTASLVFYLHSSGSSPNFAGIFWPGGFQDPDIFTNRTKQWLSDGAHYHKQSVDAPSLSRTRVDGDLTHGCRSHVLLQGSLPRTACQEAHSRCYVVPIYPNREQAQANK